MWYLQILKYRLVERLLTYQHAIYLWKERPGLRALYDSMIVGARECHYFADTELREGVGGHPLKLRRIVYSASRYSHSLPCYQPCVRGCSAYSAGIGQGNCRILIGRDRQLACAS